MNVIIVACLLITGRNDFALSFSARRLQVSMAVKHSIGKQSAERDIQKRGFGYIIGSDEVGRGCIAGPVVAASCCIKSRLNSFVPIPNVDDSKALDAYTRTRIYQQILNEPDVYAFSVAERSNKQIDDSNILVATMECFKESIEDLVEKENLPLNETYSIVDGKKTPMLSVPVPCRPWVKGDTQVYSVALASVIAKVTRDKLMTEFHELYPNYGFVQHRGYPTRAHIKAIHTYGSCPIHRMSFKPVKGR